MNPGLIIVLFGLWLCILRLRQPLDDAQPAFNAHSNMPKRKIRKRKRLTRSSDSPEPTEPKKVPLTPAQRAQATEANANSIFFTKFAAEIRLKIYEAIFSGEEYSVYLMDPVMHRRLFDLDKPDNVHVTAILQTCRQFRNEALQPFHQHARVRLVHKGGLKRFLKFNNTLLDQGQLHHVVVASGVSIRHQIARILYELPKLQSLKVLHIRENHLESINFGKSGLSRSVVLSSERTEERDFHTRGILLFCVNRFREEHVAVRNVSMIVKEPWNCELRFVCKLDLVVNDGGGNDEDAEYTEKAVVTLKPMPDPVEPVRGKLTFEFMGQVMSTRYVSRQYGPLSFPTPFRWSMRR